MSRLGVAPKPRAKAAWKVAYEAQVAGMSNADLFEQALSDQGGAICEYGDGDLTYRARTSRAELTRRLTACGFFNAGPQIGPEMPWRAIKPDDQAAIKRRYALSDKECAELTWRYHWGGKEPSYWESLVPKALTAPQLHELTDEPGESTS